MFFADYQGAPLRVLVVCTGNICRSPLAERLLATRLAAAGVPAVVTSAGTGAMVGDEMTEQAAELVTRYGAERTPHSARQVSDAILEGADVIVTASREHRAFVVSQLPRVVRRSFTLREFARLLEGARASGELVAADAATPQDLVAAAAAERGAQLPPANAADDDIVDPYRRSQQVYDEAGAVIDEATRAIAAVFQDPLTAPVSGATDTTPNDGTR